MEGNRTIYLLHTLLQNGSTMRLPRCKDVSRDRLEESVGYPSILPTTNYSPKTNLNVGTTRFQPPALVPITKITLHIHMFSSTSITDDLTVPVVTSRGIT